MIRAWVFVFTALFAVFAACGGDDEDGEVSSAPTALPAVAPTTDSPPANTPTSEPTIEVIDIPIGLPGATSYIYWLSDVDLNIIAAERPSVTVIDCIRWL
jgi:hypothetical protein